MSFVLKKKYIYINICNIFVYLNVRHTIGVHSLYSFGYFNFIVQGNHSQKYVFEHIKFLSDIGKFEELELR